MAEAEGGRKKETRGKETREETIEKERRKDKAEKPKKERTMEIKKMAEEWEIWDEKEEVAKSEEEAKKLVPEQFHQYIHIYLWKKTK